MKNYFYIFTVILFTLVLMLFSGCKCKEGEHIYEQTSVKVEATCDENGIAIYSCSECKDTIEKEIIKTGHDYEKEETLKPTCTTKGSDTYTCKICKMSYVKETDIIPHNYNSEIIKEATCFEKGTELHTCEKCGSSYETDLQIVNHKYSNATCLVPSTCEFCKTTLGVVADHDWGSDDICKICSALKYKIIYCRGITFKVPSTPFITKQVGGKTTIVHPNGNITEKIEEDKGSLKITSIDITFEYTYSSYSRFYVRYSYEKIGGEDNTYGQLTYSLYDSEGYLISGENEYTKDRGSNGTKVREDYFDFQLNHTDGDLKTGEVYTLVFETEND